MKKKVIDKIKELASQSISIDESIKDEDLSAFLMDKASKQLKYKSGIIDSNTVIDWTILFYKEKGGQNIESIESEKPQFNADGDQLSLWDA